MAGELSMHCDLVFWILKCTLPEDTIDVDHCHPFTNRSFQPRPKVVAKKHKLVSITRPNSKTYPTQKNKHRTTF